MASCTLVCSGLLRAATTRHAISRSVIRPIGFKFSSVSTTAISPQSCLTITSAACCTLCSGVQQGKLEFVKSLVCFMDLLVQIATFLIPSNRNSYFDRLWRVTRQTEYTIRKLLIKARILGDGVKRMESPILIAKNQSSFSSAGTTERFPSRCASTIQIVRRLELTAETQPKLQPRFFRLSAIISPSFSNRTKVLHAAVGTIVRIMSIRVTRLSSGV